MYKIFRLFWSSNLVTDINTTNIMNTKVYTVTQKWVAVFNVYLVWREFIIKKVSWFFFIWIINIDLWGLRQNQSE